MSIADDLKEILPSLRAIPGGDEFELHPHRVFIQTHTWDGVKIGKGQAFDCEAELTEDGSPPHVRWLSDERVALGNVSPGSIEIAPITPGHSTTSDILRGISLGQTETFCLRVDGPSGNVQYAIKSVNFQSSLTWRIIAEPVSAVENGA